MYLRILDYLKSVPKRTWLIGGGVLAAVPLVWMLAVMAQRPVAPSIPFAPHALGISGWQVTVHLSKAYENGPAFDGFFAPGKTVFIPAGAAFSVTAQPTGISGELNDGGASGSWYQNGGTLDPANDSLQVGRAPTQPGLYHLIPGSASSLGKNAIPVAANAVSVLPFAPAIGLDVLVLAESETSVKGEKTILKVGSKTIGAYLDPTKSTVKRVREHAGAYTVPRFFAALTPEAAKIRLGPDFELGQLVAFMDEHDKEGHKIFTTNRHTDVLPLRMELIDKLVKLRERLRQKGVPITRFAVTSGFRTPDYNKQIGGVPFSRHCYGDAVDIYIDENNDHHMDDLNGDGKIDRKDGEVIANACRELELEGAVVPGGIGVYEWGGDDSVRSHVHIDCRGYISRWGQSGSGKFKKSFRWWPAAEFQETENGE